MRDQIRSTFSRYSAAGIFFTFLGPSLFWLTYPRGPFIAAATAELTTHLLRFYTFRFYVFPAEMGYRVSAYRYIASALPVSLIGLITVAALHKHFGRTITTISCTAIAIVCGFFWSRYVYGRSNQREKTRIRM